MLSSEGEETYDLGKIEVGIRQLVNSSEDMKQDQMSLRKSRFYSKLSSEQIYGT